MSYDIYTGLLKAFPLRQTGNIQPIFTYNNNNPCFKQLESGYKIASVAGNGTDFSKAVNLLKWVSKHNYHKGDFNGNIPYNSLDLLKYSFCERC